GGRRSCFRRRRGRGGRRGLSATGVAPAAAQGGTALAGAAQQVLGDLGHGFLRDASRVGTDVPLTAAHLTQRPCPPANPGPAGPGADPAGDGAPGAPWRAWGWWAPPIAPWMRRGEGALRPVAATARPGCAARRGRVLDK